MDTHVWLCDDTAGWQMSDGLGSISKIFGSRRFRGSRTSERSSGLEQRRISRSWQPGATTSRWRPWPNPGFRMFRVVQHEREETGLRHVYKLIRNALGDAYRMELVTRNVAT